MRTKFLGNASPVAAMALPAMSHAAAACHAGVASHGSRCGTSQARLEPTLPGGIDTQTLGGQVAGLKHYF